MNKLYTFDLIKLKEKWEALQKLPNIFAYSLNVQKQKYLPGDFSFYAEYNPERSALRRPPQTITSLNPKYNDEQFNFNKVDEQEYLQTIIDNDVEVTLIINKSPLTKYHTLICPNLKARHAQRLTLESLKVSIKLMMQLSINDKDFRIGYNSPGALASVNHLHLHLMYIAKDIYIDFAKLEHLCNGYIFRLSHQMPTEGICWLIKKSDNEIVLENKIKEIFDFILWLCENNRPHNLFITQDRSSQEEIVKVFIFARENFCYVKDVKSFNIGFCELAGYTPVGNAELYENLTETKIIEKIRSESGNVYKDLYDFIIKQKSHEYTII